MTKHVGTLGAGRIRCNGIDGSGKAMLHQTALKVVLEDRTTLETWNLKDSMEENNSIQDLQTVLSPTGSDSSCSFSSSDSSSFACKTERSPSSVLSAASQSVPLVSDCIDPGKIRGIVAAVCVQKKSAGNGIHDYSSENFKSSRRSTYEKQLPQGNYLDLKFEKGSLIEKECTGKGVTEMTMTAVRGTASACPLDLVDMHCVSHIDSETSIQSMALPLGIHKHDGAQKEHSSKEWTDGLSYLASFGGSQYSGETSQREFSVFGEDLNTFDLGRSASERQGNVLHNCNELSFIQVQAISSTINACECSHLSRDTWNVPRTLSGLLKFYSIPSGSTIDSEKVLAQLETSPSMDVTAGESQHKSPVHSTILLPHQKLSSVCVLKASCNARDMNLRGDSKLTMSTKRSLSLDSSSSSLIVSGHLIARSFQKYLIAKLQAKYNHFLPVSKTIYYLPSPSGTFDPKRHLTPATSHRKAGVMHKIVGHITCPTTTLHGHLQCTWRDEIPTYTFLLDDCDDVLIARVCKSTNCTGKEDNAWIYTFYSRRIGAKVKGKGGWKAWGGEDKPALGAAGYMKVSSRVCLDVTSDGELKCFIESDCVLLDSRPPVMTQSRALGFRSFDDHCCFTAISSAGKTKTILPAIPAIPRRPQSIANQYAYKRSSSDGLAKESKGCKVYRSVSVKASSRHKLTSSQNCCNSDLQPLGCHLPHMQLAAIVTRVPVKQKLTSHNQLVANESWGWGLQFLQRSSASSTERGARCQVGLIPVIECGTVERGESGATVKADILQGSALEAGCEVRDAPVDCGTVERVKSSLDDRADGLTMPIGPENGSRSISDLLISKERDTKNSFHTGSQLLKAHHDDMSNLAGLEKIGKVDEGRLTEKPAHANVTVILPAGQHSLPTVESSGPSPLIERWRSGGNCDCGGWDLGCGLNILSTDRLNLCGKVVGSTACKSIESLTFNSPLQIFSQGKGKDVAVLRLAVVQDGIFSLSFQPQVLPLQAFATAVAILHSKELLLRTKARDKGHLPPPVPLESQNLR